MVGVEGDGVGVCTGAGVGVIVGVWATGADGVLGGVFVGVLGGGSLSEITGATSGVGALGVAAAAAGPLARWAGDCAGSCDWFDEPVSRSAARTVLSPSPSPESSFL